MGSGKPWIDRRLDRQLAQAAEGELVYAVLIVACDDGSATAPDDQGQAQRLLTQAGDLLGARPTYLRIIPRANALIVGASPAFLHALLADPRVVCASATTVDLL